MKATAEVEIEWVSIPREQIISTTQVIRFTSSATPKHSENDPPLQDHPVAQSKPKLQSYSVPKAVSLRFAATSQTSPEKSPTRKSFAFGSTLSLAKEDCDPSLSRSGPPLKDIANRVPTSARSWRSAPRVTLSTPASSRGTALKIKVPETAESDKCLSLDRILHYDGGPAVLVEGGGLAIHASGPILVVSEIQNNPSSERMASGAGLWALFSADRNAGSHNRHAFLHGHSQPVCHIKVSVSGKYLISAEGGSAALLIVWNIHASGAKKVAAFRPFEGGIRCIAMSDNEAMLCVVGWDRNRRLQINVFDMQALLRDKIGITPPSPSKVPVILARQMSDFDVIDMVFSPIAEDSLISCGRENVRFWRMKKSHLPGRPVALNEYARGNDFLCLRYYIPESTTSVSGPQPNKPCVFVGSTKGVLLRIDCEKEQVMCAYQLHNAGIVSIVLLRGVAVTGSSDKVFRIWPMDFTDFLLEAYHESPITCVEAAEDGKTLVIGTASGTLGFLNALDHSYTTILRSHTKTIVAASSKTATSEEFVSLSNDGSIRIWDTLSLEQKYEFNSTADQPLVAAFHPHQGSLAVGFSSGALRIFDIATTCQTYELTYETAVPCASLLFIPSGSRLFKISANGHIEVFDTVANFSEVKSISAFDVSAAGAVEAKVYSAMNKDGSLLACCARQLGSLCVVHTSSLQVIFRVQTASSSPTVPLYRPAGSATGALSQLTTSNQLRTDSSNIEKMQDSFGEVVGLSFLSNGGNQQYILLGCTRYLVSLPVVYRDFGLDQKSTSFGDAGQSRSPEVLWGDRSFRRVDFGIPRSLLSDSNGIIFMLLETPDSNSPAESRQANALAVFSVRLKSAPHSNRSQIALSAVQVFRQSEGSGGLTAVVPCLNCERVIACDSSGAVYAWKIQSDNLARQVPPSPTQLVTPDASMAHNGTFITTGLSTSKIQRINDLTAAFETALEENPRIWSADSDLPAGMVALEVEEEDCVGRLAANAEPIDEGNDDNFVTNRNPSMLAEEEHPEQAVEAPKLVADQDALETSVSEDKLELQTSHSDHDASFVEDEIMSPLPSASKASKTFDRMGYSASGHISSVELVSSRIVVPPLYCPSKKSLLSSDGGTMFLKDLSSSQGVFLVGGGCTPSRKIFATSISPDGCYAAALTHAPHSDSTNKSALSSVQLLLWYTSELGSWSFLGSFILLEASRSIFIDWTLDGDFVLFHRLDSAAGEAIMKVVRKQNCSDKALFGASLGKPGVQLSLRGEVDHAVVLDRIVESLTDPRKMAVLTRGGGRMHLFLVDLEHMSSALEWSEFIGKGRRYLVADVSCIAYPVLKPASNEVCYASSPRSALLLSIDSSGLETIRATAFKFDDSHVRSKLHLAHLQGPYAFGAPRSLKISTCGTHVVIGHNMCVRIMSLTVKDIENPELCSFSVALTTMYKVSSLMYCPSFDSQP